MKHPPKLQAQPRDAQNGRTSDSPKLASGFSSLTRSRQSATKNMYADSARLGAPLLPLAALPFAARGAFSAFSAALRCQKGKLVSSFRVRHGLRPSTSTTTTFLTHPPPTLNQLLSLIEIPICLSLSFPSHSPVSLYLNPIPSHCNGFLKLACPPLLLSARAQRRHASISTHDDDHNTS